MPENGEYDPELEISLVEMSLSYTKKTAQQC